MGIFPILCRTKCTHHTISPWSYGLLPSFLFCFDVIGACTVAENYIAITPPDISWSEQVCVVHFSALQYCLSNSEMHFVQHWKEISINECYFLPLPLLPCLLPHLLF